MNFDPKELNLSLGTHVASLNFQVSNLKVEIIKSTPTYFTYVVMLIRFTKENKRV